MTSLLRSLVLLISFSLFSPPCFSTVNADEAKTRWDRIPFLLYQEQTDFKANHLIDNEAVSRNYGVRTYALPKDLPVRILSKSYANGKSYYYIQLPDGSLGYVPGYALEETRVRYSNEWEGTAEHFNGWARSEKRVGGETYRKYVWTHPEVTVKTDKGTKKTALNHVQVTTKTVKSIETEEDRHISKHIIIIKNPEDIKNLAGYDKKYVERRFGKAKNFAGDALTEVGYAYSYYQNIAIESHPDKYKIYGMAVYYNKDMQVVDAAFITSVDGNFRKETVRRLKLPAKAGSLCRQIDVASGHQKASGIPTYNVRQKYKSYEISEPTYIYSMFRYPEKTWHLGLAALCITVLLTVLGLIESKISGKDTPVFGAICYVFIIGIWIYSLIIYLPNGLIAAILKSFVVLFICLLPALGSVINTTVNEQPVVPTCPYCNAPESYYEIDSTVVSICEKTTRKDKYIRSSYETVYNDNFEQDVANATPYKTVWTSMRQEMKQYQEVRIIEHNERYKTRYRCNKCRMEWDSGIRERTVKTETVLGDTYWISGGFSDVKSFDPGDWEVIDHAKRNLRR